ncbi:MAG: aminotransferase class III-fold pyridoxal phosphate-dependent enzyme [Fibrobacteria bacterium]|nr:aminotransferase class III-fold pyridoxal phosphate-dependent enzyme [Fibrobacteria bacterium]
MGGATRPDLVFASGSGSWLTDVEGREILDFVAGWAVCSLGHSPEVISRAMQAQSTALLHCSPGFWNPSAVKLAEKLAHLTGMEKVFLGTTGAEANECAIKLARKWGLQRRAGAWRVVSTLDGFHGRTLATMAATGKAHWKDLFGPGVPGFDHVPFGDAQALEQAIGSETCAVLLEPVQGEGGVWVGSREYLGAVREICDRRGVLLIADEVQAGLGRCGSWLACQRVGIHPDIVTLGKGLGGGIPVSACLARAELDLFEPGDQGGTFTYHPFGAAVALAVLEAIEEGGLLDAAREGGERICEILRLHELEGTIRQVRGAGLLRAFDLPQPRAHELVEIARGQGLLLNAPRPQTIRLCPALTVSPGEVEEFGTRLGQSLRLLGDPKGS